MKPQGVKLIVDQKSSFNVSIIASWIRRVKPKLLLIPIKAFIIRRLNPSFIASFVGKKALICGVLSLFFLVSAGCASLGLKSARSKDRAPKRTTAGLASLLSKAASSKAVQRWHDRMRGIPPSQEFDYRGQDYNNMIFVPESIRADIQSYPEPFKSHFYGDGGFNFADANFEEAKMSYRRLFVLDTDQVNDLLVQKDKIHFTYRKPVEVTDGNNRRREIFPPLSILPRAPIDFDGDGNLKLLAETFLKRDSNFSFELSKIRLVQMRSDIGFTYSDLTNASMKNGIFDFFPFNFAHLNFANMANGSFLYSTFIHTVVSSANFTGAKLWGALFHTHAMPGAVFNKAELNGATLKIKRDDIISDSLDKEGFDRFEELSFMSDDLRGYYPTPRGEKSPLPTQVFVDEDPNLLKKVNFQGALYNDYTIFPEGFDPKKAGMIFDDNPKIPGDELFRRFSEQ